MERDTGKKKKREVGGRNSGVGMMLKSIITVVLWSSSVDSHRKKD